MRQRKTLTQTLLILFIINFALAAPVAVRERPEARLDANVRRNVATASQKRWDPMDLGGSPDVPVPDHAPPPRMDSTSWSELMRMFGHGHTDSTQLAPDIPGSVPGSHPPPPPSSTHLTQLGPSESHFPSRPDFLSLNPDTSLELVQKYWMKGHGYTDGTQLAPDIPGSVPGSHPPPPPSSSHLSQLGPSESHFPSPPDLSLNPDTSWGLMQMFGMAGHGHTDNTQPAPDIPGSVAGSRLPVGSMPLAGSHPPPPPSSSHFSQLGPSESHFPSPPDLSLNPDTSWGLMQMFGMAGHGHTDNTQPAPDIPGSVAGSRLPVGSMPVAGSLPPPPPALPHLSQLGPSEGHSPSPPDFSVNPGTPSSVGSTLGAQLTPPQSPGDPEIQSLMDPEPFPSEFWENLLKGRIKRRISGSDAVY